MVVAAAGSAEPGTEADSADAFDAASLAATVYPYVVPATAVVSENDVDATAPMTLPFRRTV